MNGCKTHTCLHNRKEQPMPFLLRGPFHPPLSVEEVLAMD